MQRGSDRHGPKRDEELKAETRSMMQANRPTRAEEALEAEPPADDDPDALTEVQRTERPRRDTSE
ncbi:hypothetical protein C1701_05395 [Actinoalloteichus sp. AHMU CJ021]|uniref:Uncharacterized protein n=1 Tax=Actinoalloteichus caeruleus DSM 43889 TaxID=1120930 RepID=A0ABT1JI84_ACTCY|nr:hypothetical protein [Actinoalloteichus caeruleus]AUS77897.1 hypothetical protein C1701_05395 [Actinoalloteichus sp. AHMU CJ021]MCP2331861.1 hypothetical protein [Actinoalloteichus caeruleus DSM 43889]